MPALGLALVDVASRGRRRPAFDFSDGVPPGAILTRASAGGRIDAAGRYTLTPADAARFDHDPQTLALRGLLVEPASTNLVAGRAAIGGAGWAIYGPPHTPILGGNTIAPDGSETARQVTVADSSDPAAISVVYAAGTVAGATATGSIWVRGPAPGGQVYLMLTDGVAFSSVAVPVTGSWARHAVGWTTTGSTSLYLEVGVHRQDPAQAGSGTVTVELWGAQLESGGVATSHIPTDAGTASRAADAVTLDWGGQGVPDGPATVRYSFDDGSTQDVATTIAGGLAAVPTTLNRRWLRRAEQI